MALLTQKDCAIYCDATVASSVIVDADNRLVRWEDLSGHDNYIDMFYPVSGPLYNGDELVLDGERLTSQSPSIPSSGDFVMVAYAAVSGGGNIMSQPGSGGMRILRDSANRFRFDTWSGGSLDPTIIGGISPSEAYRVWLGCRRGNDLIARVDGTTATETHAIVDDAPGGAIETSGIIGAYRRFAVIPGTFSDGDLDEIVSLMAGDGLPPGRSVPIPVLTSGGL